MSSGKYLELYIHIPFCVRKCAYCDFLSWPARKEETESYIKALEKEIGAERTGRERPVSSVFIGGGTPSLLPPEQIVRILQDLREAYRFTPDAEISIEANPGTLSLEKLSTYRKAGINRLSLGLQSWKEEELAVLGRIHTPQDFLDSFKMARDCGFQNINVDLMFALPGQRREDWQDNLNKTAALGPEHISAYSLILEEGTPLAEKKDLIYPDEDTEYLMYDDTERILSRYGYRQYEISNYAREGFECRHNIGYWERRDYLGFGLGAASFIRPCRFSNTRRFTAYLADSGAPEKIRVDREELSREEEMAEFCFLGLRMRKGFSCSSFEQEFGVPVEEVYGEVIRKYQELGLLRKEAGRIRLTRKGIHVSNTVMADFIL